MGGGNRDENKIKCLLFLLLHKNSIFDNKKKISIILLNTYSEDPVKMHTKSCQRIDRQFKDHPFLDFYKFSFGLNLTEIEKF